MDDFKTWYQSKAVWGSLAAIVAGILSSAHVISPSDAADVAATAPGLLASFGAVIGGVVALYGRIAATHRIK